MIEAIERLLKDLREELASLYGNRLRGVFVFGSYARGDAAEGSDVDVLIVLDRLDSYGSEIDRTSGIVSRTSLQYGASVSRVFISERDWNNGAGLFLESIREECIPA